MPFARSVLTASINVALGLADALLTELVASLLELPQLLGRVVLLDHAHHLDGSYELIERRPGRLLELLEQARQRAMKSPLEFQALLDAGQVPPDGADQVGMPLQRCDDLLER